MKNMKRLLPTILMMCLVLSMSCVFAFAQETEEDVLIPIITVDENATESEIVDSINSYMKTDEQSTRGYIEINPFLIRSGNTPSCQLYLKWDCPTYQCSMISFALLQLHNGFILDPDVYANIGGSTIPCETGSKCSAFVSNVTIPTSVSAVYASSENVKAYILSHGWISTVSFSGRVSFN